MQEIGEYKAPIEKDNSKKFRMLCLEHVKEFNKIGIIFQVWMISKLLIFKIRYIYKPTQVLVLQIIEGLWNNVEDELDKESLRVISMYTSI